MLGKHLHSVVQLQADRKQYFATFFLRNRAELELMRRLVIHKARFSNLNVSVLACSKGAEVYSIAWTLRRARPDLKVKIYAVDISQEILEFAENGIYSNRNLGPSRVSTCDAIMDDRAVNTCLDQNASIFERMNRDEVESIFEVGRDELRVRSWLKEGITWLRADAGDPQLAGALGPQDIVVANRFLCHMEPAAARRCLISIARLVGPGGYLFVSGIDLDVRTRVAREMGWKPITELMREVHEGDSSIRRGWPLRYWGLEPFYEHRSDWMFRYASVFRIGELSPS
jgi:chemotaxis methyl-accepting protein methylase